MLYAVVRLRVDRRRRRVERVACAAATPGSRPSSADQSPTAAAFSGSVSVWPAGRLHDDPARGAPPPAPNSSSISSSAVVDSWPGMEKVLDVSPASVTAPTPPPTRTASQTRTTASRCRCGEGAESGTADEPWDQASTR